MGKYFSLALVLAFLLPFGAKNAHAEVLNLTSTYDLGDNYSLNFGKRAGGLRHGRNIVGLKKSDAATEGDALVFTLVKPHEDFGGDSASLGVVYTAPLQKNVTGIFSLTGGPAEGSLGTPDVALSFHIHIKLP
jgi:hypothetical protein